MDASRLAKADGPDPAESTAERSSDQASGEGKSAKQLQKEKAKADKAAKFAAKQAKAKQFDRPAKQIELKGKSIDVSQLIEETPLGQKKRLAPLDSVAGKSYHPAVVESGWYSWWEQSGLFQPELLEDGARKPAGYFVIPQPPPNVTGALHCGHAMATTLQDTLIRWNRMKGLTTLYVPGCDHAGISTQSVVEKMLWTRQGKTRHDLGRSKFVSLVWDWKEEYHAKINKVLRRMGASLDWSREAFTMDSNLSAAVLETFCRLYEEGYIYRANRLVNWCTHLNTALSNLEVVPRELAGRTMIAVPGYDRKIEFGVLVHFRYLVEGTDETIEVATTRPETMLGDSGIAVHPDDQRYKSLIGRKARHPFVDRLLPIVGDTHVDPAFGTGAVKITPAHDPNDFEIGKRHGLESINILTDDGLLNGEAGPFRGQKRFDVRYAVVEELTKLGLFVKKVDNPMTIPLCEKSKDVIEPLVKAQWWCKMDEMSQAAIAAVRAGEVKIRPDTAEKSFFRWLESPQDWCLSRQLWWGHQIPAYRVEFDGSDREQHPEASLWVVGRTEEEARARAAAKFPNKTLRLTRDPDVLDTWFSSALWPFSTLGWPRQTSDLKNFYPTSVLETGWDILFFWVARMIMFGIKLTGRVPFSEVYCHALVRDTEGRKMSKSLGNVIDPIDLIDGIDLDTLHGKLLTGNLDPKEVKTAKQFQKTAFPHGIPECGTDALRFCLAQYATGNDINFDINVMHAHRRFCNKIFQATRYVLGKIEPDFVPQANHHKTGKETLSERWILHKFTTATREVDQALSDRAFPKAAQVIYAFWYDHLCDVFIENSKTVLQAGTSESIFHTLYNVLEGALKMIHPLMPYLSEELWQRLRRRPGELAQSISKASYPQFEASWIDGEAEEAYNLVLGCSRAVRSLSGEYGIKNAVPAFIQPSTPLLRQRISDSVTDVSALLGPAGSHELVVLAPGEEPPSGCVVSVVSAEVVVFLRVEGHVDPATETAKLKTRIQQASDSISKLQGQISSAEFMERSNEEVREGLRQTLKEQEARRINFEQSLAQLSALMM